MGGNEGHTCQIADAAERWRRRWSDDENVRWEGAGADGILHTPGAEISAIGQSIYRSIGPWIIVLAPSDRYHRRAVEGRGGFVPATVSPSSDRPSGRFLNWGVGSPAHARLATFRMGACDWFILRIGPFFGSP